MSLNGEQQRIYDAVIGGRSLFFTGSAGTGKSFLLKAIIRGLEGKRTAVTAPTGVAAINIGGITVHKCFDLMRPAVSRATIARIAALEVLVIDEISMLGARTFDRVCALIDAHRKDPRPLQYVFCGDFMQLPPIGEPMCFLSTNWRRADTCACLREIVRQKDATFCGILNRARYGEVTAEDLALLNTRREVEGVVELHTHRVDTDVTNNERMMQLDGPSTFFHAEDTADKDSDLDLLLNCQAPRMLELRIGARVLLLRNLYREDGALAYVNGSTGAVVTAAPSMLRVLFDDGDVQTLERVAFQVKDGKKLLASRLQYPLTLAYATTIHKAQGLTIARVQVRLAAAFEAGQAYVALSRATALEHLVVDGIVRKGTFLVNRDAARFMRLIEAP